jgi:amino acid transporter
MLNSVIVICLASTIVVTRMIYALSRAGIAPQWLGKLHPRYKSPANATLTLTVLSLVIGVIGAVTLGAANSYFVYGLFFTILLIIVYIGGNYAVGRYFWRTFRGEFRPWKHVALPVVTSIALVYVGYKSVVPLPAYPVGAGVWVAIGWIAVAIAIAVGTRRRTRDMDLATLASQEDETEA